MDYSRIVIEKYKCFNEVEISGIKNINIIIGKNNIGKSSILDVIEMIYGNKKVEKAKILLTKEMTENIIRTVFRENTSGGEIPGNHYQFGKNYIDKQLTFLRKDKMVNDVSDNFEKYNQHLPSQPITFWSNCARCMKITPKSIKRILAERNIFSEDNDDDMELDSNGNGITKVITNYLNRSKYNENLIRGEFLDTLNEIMGEDASFTEIVTQQVETPNGTKWEIFLREEGKGRISLSSSGSGLKTILMVLVFTILVPNIENKEISDYIFLFEELENNLHPSLQRRLLSYIEKLADNGAMFFLTTHSNITLDAYQNSDLINILHVQKNGKNIEINNVTEKIQKNSILDDLGVKASDLLQANGIIWVEGPSDRIYINKWLEMFGNKKMREGKDYQCIFYGGRLLSNLTLEDEEELVNLMNINRNAIIVLDSDKKNLSTPLNQTKKRIIKQAESNGILTWVTKGREIENYIPDSIIKRYYGKIQSKKIFGQFQNIEDYIDFLKKNEGKRFLRNKTEFAKNILNISSREDFENIYDLKKTINRIINEINKWNKNQ